MCRTAEQRQDQDVCVICLESISEKAIAQPCRHDSFDFLCLVTWLEQRYNIINNASPGSETTALLNVGCPLCKASIRSITYNYRSHTNFQTYQLPDRHVRIRNTPSTGIVTHASHQVSQRPFRRARPRPQRLQPSADTAIARRKDVYRDKSYSLHVGTNRLSRFQDTTPQQFQRDEELKSRARKWIRRELQVFDFLNSGATIEGKSCQKANNAEFLLEYIIAILKSVDVKGSSGQAHDMLQEFLGPDNSRLFLHELQAWLRSPYTQLDDWDRHVQYGPPTCTSGLERQLVLKTAEHHTLSSPVPAANNSLKRKDRSRLYDSYRPDREHSISTVRHRALNRYVPDSKS